MGIPRCCPWGAPFGDREDEGRVRRSLERGRYAPLHAEDEGVV